MENSYKRLILTSIAIIALIFAACEPVPPSVPPTQPPFTPITGITNTPIPVTPATATRTPVPPTRTPVPATNTTRPTSTSSRTPTRTLTPTRTPTRAPVTATVASTSGVVTGTLPQGFVAQKGFWQVYFTAPTGNRDTSTYFGGVDEMLAANIAAARQTVDMAAYEFNSPALTRALLDAHARGVRVRIVTDLQDGFEDEETTLDQLVAAGISIVTDTRTALMHNKFTIIDSTFVWMGAMNYTINDTYRNNNNSIVLRSRQAVENYQAEFDEMFIDRQFGPRSPSDTPNVSFVQDGIPIEIYFAAEDDVVPAILREINAANQSIRFMAFSFTLDSLAQAMITRSMAGVDVSGIFENVGSETQFSELRPMFCAGLEVRQDGNPFVLHHKVIIVDNTTVLSGSFNFSDSATNSNDENLVIIRDPDLTAQFIVEFNRRWAEAEAPDSLTCS
jgi:phosphatidylserine/phosphatidylglycerophosphate/cardiolipin synthase-like enzyme